MTEIVDPKSPCAAPRQGLKVSNPPPCRSGLGLQTAPDSAPTQPRTQVPRAGPQQLTPVGAARHPPRLSKESPLAVRRPAATGLPVPPALPSGSPTPGRPATPPPRTPLPPHRAAASPPLPRQAPPGLRDPGLQPPARPLRPHRPAPAGANEAHAGSPRPPPALSENAAAPPSQRPYRLAEAALAPLRGSSLTRPVQGLRALGRRGWLRSRPTPPPAAAAAPRS